MQHGRLGHVGAASRLRVGHARLGKLPLERDVDEPGERLGDPPQVGLLPAGCRRGVQPAVAAGQRQAQRHLTVPGRGGGLQAQAGARRPGRLRHGAANGLELGLQLRPGHHVGGRAGEHCGLPPARGRLARAVLCLPGALAGRCRQASDHHGRDQEHDQRHDVLRAGDGEPVPRLDEEVVERQDGQQRRDQRGELAPADRHEQHGEQIDDTQAGDRRDRVERGHDAGRGRDREHDLEGGDHDRTARCGPAKRTHDGHL